MSSESNSSISNSSSSDAKTFSNPQTKKTKQKKKISGSDLNSLPEIQAILDDPNTNTLKFTITNINVSLANAIRRVIISEIPTIVFRTFPYEHNKSEFIKNTSRMNNEILKQRLSCIPINVKIEDSEDFINNHILEVDVRNESDIIKYVTTEDFKVKNKHTGMYIEDIKQKEIFPPDPFTNDYIVFARLKPPIGANEIKGEHVKFTSEFDIGIAKEDSAFNVASTCCYKAVVDIEKANEIWNEKEKKMLQEETPKEEIKKLKNDWFLLDAKRQIIDDSFEFTIKTIGQYSNTDLVAKACEIIIDKFDNYYNKLEEDINLIETSIVTIENCFDVNLPEGEDYTLGKVIEYLLYYKHMKSIGVFDNTITFCGFRKPHPHLNKSYIRVAFDKKIEKEQVKKYIYAAIEDAKKIYNIIYKKFSK